MYAWINWIQMRNKSMKAANQIEYAGIQLVHIAEWVTTNETAILEGMKRAATWTKTSAHSIIIQSPY
jgi:hypothetical protein